MVVVIGKLIDCLKRYSGKRGMIGHFARHFCTIGLFEALGRGRNKVPETRLLIPLRAKLFKSALPETSSEFNPFELIILAEEVEHRRRMQDAGWNFRGGGFRW